MKRGVNDSVTHDLNGRATITAVLENAYEITFDSGVRTIALPHGLRTTGEAAPAKPLFDAPITVVRLVGQRVAKVDRLASALAISVDPYSVHRRRLSAKGAR